MSKVFRITPKTTKRVNNTVLTPEMEIIVTTEHHTQDPFYNGAKEIIAISSARTDKCATDHPDRVKLDRKRKGVIKAIFRWFELRGQHPTMEYVKSVACRAAKKERFNDISLCELTRVYAEFCHKQESLSAMQNVELGIASRN